MNLRALIEFASRQSESIFNETEVIYPLYHAITATREHVLFTPPAGIDDKDIMVAMVKLMLARHNVESYVLMDEAWIYDSRWGEGIDVEQLRREGLRSHPDRREIVMFSAENRKGEMLTASRYILRPEIGKPTLAPLRIDDRSSIKSSGRMVGLLEPSRW